jgi:hypothetical protein
MRRLQSRITRHYRLIVIFAALLVAGSATTAGLLAATASDNDRVVSKKAKGWNSAGHRTAATPGPAELAKMKSVALQVAAATGDPHPESARAYPTSRSTANKVASFGASADTDEPVYLIVVHGNFNATSLPLPGGAPAPTGSIETIVWDPARDVITDFGIKNRVPNAATIGEGFDLGL